MHPTRQTEALSHSSCWMRGYYCPWGLIFTARDFSRTNMLNSKKRSFRWTNGLLNMLGFYLQQVVVILKYFLFAQDVDFIRPIHLFVTAKKSGWVRCYCHVQSGFCLKIWWTINPWAFCTICKLELHVVALVLPSTCHYTAASSMAAVRSRTRPCRRSPPWLARCARRRLVLSTWSTTKRNQEMTVRGEADSRDPPGSLHFASRCLVITSQNNTSS